MRVNGERAVRARTPNEFYHYMVRKVGQGTDPLTGQPADLSSRAIVGRAQDLAPVFGVSSNRLSDLALLASNQQPGTVGFRQTAGSRLKNSSARSRA